MEEHLVIAKIDSSSNPQGRELYTISSLVEMRDYIQWHGQFGDIYSTPNPAYKLLQDYYKVMLNHNLSVPKKDEDLILSLFIARDYGSRYIALEMLKSRI